MTEVMDGGSGTQARQARIGRKADWSLAPSTSVWLATTSTFLSGCVIRISKKLELEVY